MLQAVNQNGGNQCAGGGGGQKRDNVGIERNLSRVLPHEQNRYRVGAQSAENCSSEDLRDQRCKDVFGFFVNETAQQSAEHTAGEGHKASETEQVSKQACDKRGQHPVPGAEQNRAQHVYHVLNGRALTAENGEREHTADDGDGAEDGGNGELFGVGFHPDLLL